MTDDHREQERDKMIDQRLDALEAQYDQIVDVLMGVESLAGQRTGGMKDKLNMVYEKVINGGVKIRIPTGAWVAIIVAIITGIFNVVAVLV